MSKTYRKFTAKFKLQVIAAAEETNNIQVATKFGVIECHVQRWIKDFKVF